MKKQNWIWGLLVFCVVVCAKPVDAMIMISEIHADPATGVAGDADNNGVRSSTGDEFVEIFNGGTTAIDLTGWQLDDATQTRHVFAHTLMPQEYFAVFGSSASTGGLSLNNSGDTLTLFDAGGDIVDQVMYDALANQNQSIVRVGDDWVLHTQFGPELFSPNASHPVAAAVPEPVSWLTFTLGWMGLRRFQTRQNV